MLLLAQLPTEQLVAQLKNGLVLLALGMSIVFLFLTILVFTTKGVSKVVRKFEKKKPVAQVAAPAAASAAVKNFLMCFPHLFLKRLSSVSRMLPILKPFLIPSRLKQ